MFLRQIGDGLENVFPITGIKRTEPDLAPFQVDGPHPLFLVLIDARPMAENALDQHARFDLAPLERAAEFPVAFDQEFRFFPGGIAFFYVLHFLFYAIMAETGITPQGSAGRKRM